MARRGIELGTGLIWSLMAQRAYYYAFAISKFNVSIACLGHAMTVRRGFEDTRPTGIISDDCHGLRELNLLQSKSILSVWSRAWSKLFYQLCLGFLSKETSHFTSEGSLGVS